jgi:hypothetical protein
MNISLLKSSGGEEEVGIKVVFRASVERMTGRKKQKTGRSERE